MFLDDDQIEAIRVKCGRVGVVDYSGHQLVFKRPDRATVREYRRKQDSPAEKPDCLDQLAQALIVSFDGEQDGVRARTAFNAFLDEFPAFTSTGKCQVVIASLTGMVEVEEGEDLGKGVSVRSSPPKTTPAASPTGSGTSSGTKR